MKGPESIRVLVVEDDYLVGEMIKGLLRDAGYAIAGVATNGREAIEMVQSMQPDVVLMDIEMPDMDGIEATWRMQERCPTPVVVLTAHETQELVEKASMAGVGSYLIKPPSSREVGIAITIAMARFDDMIELRRLNAELRQALDEVQTLGGLLPICSACKKIRDDEGYWHQVEVYIRDHSDAEFSHGLCPDCARQLYPDIFGDDE